MGPTDALLDALLYKPDKTREDIDRLIGAHKNLVYAMLSKYGQLFNQDAESAAFEALWDAVAMFDVYTNTAFSTFACTLIKCAIRNIIRERKSDSRSNEIAADMQRCGAAHTGIGNSGLRIYQLFGKYIQTKKGLAKNVLLAWYSLDFDSSDANIARMCKCSRSQVGKIKLSFRIYLTSALKE